MAQEEYAFPFYDESWAATGMTLRDWFAGQALAGLLACPDDPQLELAAWARNAYAYADAMLVAREKGR